MKILISSPYWLFRGGFVSFINHESSFEVIGETSTAAELLEFSRSKADVILLDIDLFEDSDFGEIKKLSEAFPSSAIIVLCSDENTEKVVSSISHGAIGFLSKNINKANLIASLKAVEKGEALLPRKLVATVITKLTKIPQNQMLAGLDLSQLTYREFEVLRCLRDQDSNREIAKKLVISENTVRVHVHNILKKLDVQSRREAAQLAKHIKQLD